MGDITNDCEFVNENRLSIQQSLFALQQLRCPVSECGPPLLNLFSRSLQRKLEALLKCNLSDPQGPSAAVRLALLVAERVVSDLTHYFQGQQHVNVSLWTAVRSHGCQFLGPAMQEEVLKLILLALEDGSSLSRKVLVLFIVQRLQVQFPQASKTAVGHVVQLLYRASCFNIIKRDEDSSLMQLKPEYRDYKSLRYEHDMQIVEISQEFGLRIGPEQWSCLLYGDGSQKSHMQSVIDKLSRRQTLVQSAGDLVALLKKCGDSLELSSELEPQLDLLVNFQQNSTSKTAPTSWCDLDCCLKALLKVINMLARLLQQRQEHKGDNILALQNCKHDSYKQTDEIQSAASLASESHNLQTRSSGHPEPPVAFNRMKSCEAGQMMSGLPSTSSPVDELCNSSTALRLCDLDSTETQLCSPAVPAIPEDGIYPAVFPNGITLPRLAYSSCGSLPFHVLPQPQYVSLPLGAVSDARVPTSVPGTYCHSPVLLSFHNIQTPSDYIQPLWYPNGDSCSHSEAMLNVIPSSSDSNYQ